MTAPQNIPATPQSTPHQKANAMTSPHSTGGATNDPHSATPDDEIPATTTQTDTAPAAATETYSPAGEPALHLPYGQSPTAQGFTPGTPLTSPVTVVSSGSTALSQRERRFSPLLAVSGLVAMTMAIWSLLGATEVGTEFWVWAALVAAILVGITMIVGALRGGRDDH